MPFALAGKLVSAQNHHLLSNRASTETAVLKIGMKIAVLKVEVLKVEVLKIAALKDDRAPTTPHTSSRRPHHHDEGWLHR